MANPTTYSLELRNKNFDLVKILTNISRETIWGYNRIGGCGNCELNLAAEILQDIGADYDIQIRLEDGQGGTNLRYRGYVDTYKPVVDVNPSVRLNAFGYSGQLARVRVNHIYTDQEVSVIIKDILDNYVLPETKILYDSADIEETQFTVDEIEFDVMADSAIKTLADLAGKIEWGVDVGRKFFFKLRSEENRHYLKYGIDVSKFDPLYDYGAIINRYHIKGGKVGGIVFEHTVNNTESQDQFRLRSRTINNSAIVSSVVAEQYGAMKLAETAKIQTRVSVKAEKVTHFFEETTPLGRINIIGTSILPIKKYGDSDAIYGKFRYGGNQSFQIESIKYTLKSEGVKVEINAGAARPDVAENIKKLEFEIDQMRNK